MPETIKRPKVDTGLENISVAAGPENKHKNMDFEDEVNIIPPYGRGMT